MQASFFGKYTVEVKITNRFDNERAGSPSKPHRSSLSRRFSSFRSFRKSTSAKDSAQSVIASSPVEDPTPPTIISSAPSNPADNEPAKNPVVSDPFSRFECPAKPKDTSISWLPSETHRDSIYNLLQAVTGAIPIPISPCITLIKEIDKTLHRVHLQIPQCWDLLDLAASMLHFAQDTLQAAQTEAERRIDSATITPVSEGNSSTLKLIEDLHLLLNQLLEFYRELAGSPLRFLERIQQENEIKIRLEAFKISLTATVDKYKLGQLIKMDVWQMEYAESQKENIRRHEMLVSHLRELNDKTEKTIEIASHTDTTVALLDERQKDDHTRDVVKYYPDYLYRGLILKKILGFDAAAEVDHILNNEQLWLANNIRSGDSPKNTRPSPGINLAYEGGQSPKYCLKVYRLKGVRPVYTQRLLEEIQISHQIHHPNIVQFYGINTTVNRIYDESLNLMLEYCTEGTLQVYLQKSFGEIRRDSSDEIKPAFHETAQYRETTHFLYEVAQALEYLHSGEATSDRKSIIHGDVRPSKILITRSSDGQRHAKLNSFRRSRMLDKADLEAEGMLSRGPDNEIWRAPETQQGRTDSADRVIFTMQTKSDVFGWAVTAAAILCTDWTAERNSFKIVCPYSGQEDDRGAWYVLKESIKVDEPFEDEQLRTAIPEEGLRALLKESWAKDPDARPHMSEISAQLKVISGFESANGKEEHDVHGMVSSEMNTRAELLTPPETPPEEKDKSLPPI